jgi:LysR family hydrogen peroxide-inducible transcriptional activator
MVILDAAIATHIRRKIKEIVLYFEPFVAYIPENHHTFSKKKLNK